MSFTRVETPLYLNRINEYTVQYWLPLTFKGALFMYDLNRTVYILDLNEGTERAAKSILDILEQQSSVFALNLRMCPYRQSIKDE